MSGGGSVTIHNHAPVGEQRVEGAPDAIMEFFGYAHLPQHMQEVSKRFAELAAFICALPRNAERSTALRKVLEAKDCAVRAAMAKPPMVCTVEPLPSAAERVAASMGGPAEATEPGDAGPRGVHRSEP